MISFDQPASRFSIDKGSLRGFLLRAQREAELSGEVNVLITSNDYMRRLNREFRGKDEATDVLSFPASPNGGKGVMGDIAISAEIASSNARSLNHSFEQELKILLLHGVLHLAGYDHETDNGEMAHIEQRLRAKLKLPSSLIERANGLENHEPNVGSAGASPKHPQAGGGRIHVKRRKARSIR